MKDIEEVSGDVLDVAMQLHRKLGPGLLESVYEVIMAAKLVEMGYPVARQQPVDIEYEGLHFPSAFKIDLLVDERLLVEVKSVDQLHACACQAAAHLFAALEAARRAAHQFWRSDLEGGCSPIGERLQTLFVSASPREQIMRTETCSIFQE